MIREAASDEERDALRRAWDALGPLATQQVPAPRPSAELERIFRGQDGRMSDDDLDMVAAAGTVSGTDDPNYLVGGGDADDMSGHGGNDYMFGHGGDDTMSGGEGNDYMLGGAGNDVLSGGEGNDALMGGDGDDSLSGGAGDDTLIGGAGDDMLMGGEGSDEFVFSNASGSDTVMDFVQGTDTVTLLGVSSMQDFTVNSSSGDTVITFGDSTITLVGVSLTAEEIWAMQGQS